MIGMYSKESGGLQSLYSAVDLMGRRKREKEAEEERKRQLEEQRRQQREANKHSAFGDTLKLIGTVGGAVAGGMYGDFSGTSMAAGAAIGGAASDLTMAFAPNVGGTQPGADNPYYTPTTDTQKALTAVNAGLQFYSAYETAQLDKERKLAMADAANRRREYMNTQGFQATRDYVSAGFDASQGYEGLQGTEYQAMPSLARDLKDSGQYTFLRDEDLLLIAAGEADKMDKFGPTLETLTLQGTELLYRALEQKGATAQSVLADLDAGETAWAREFRKLPVASQVAAKSELMKQSRATLAAANTSLKEKAAETAKIFNERANDAVKRLNERVDDLVTSGNLDGVVLPAGVTLADLQGSEWASDPQKVRALLGYTGTGDDMVQYMAMKQILGAGRDTEILAAFPEETRNILQGKAITLGIASPESMSEKPAPEVGEGDLTKRVDAQNNSLMEELYASDDPRKWDLQKQDQSVPSANTDASANEVEEEEPAVVAPTTPVISTTEEPKTDTQRESAELMKKADSALAKQMNADKVDPTKLIEPVAEVAGKGLRGEYLGSYGGTPKPTEKVAGQQGAIRNFAGSALSTLSNITQLRGADEAYDPDASPINKYARMRITNQLDSKSVDEQLSERRSAEVQDAGKITTSPTPPPAPTGVLEKQADDLKAQIKSDNETRANQEQTAEASAANKSPLYEILDLQEEITTNLDSAAEKVRAAEEISRQLVTSGDTEKSTNYYMDVQTAKTELAQLANVVSRAEQANAGKQAKPLTEQKTVFQELNQQAQRLNANLDTLLKGEPLPTTDAAPDTAAPAEVPPSEVEPSAFETETLQKQINDAIRSYGKLSRGSGGISGVNMVKENTSKAQALSLEPDALARAASWFDQQNFIPTDDPADNVSSLEFLLQQEINDLVLKAQYNDIPLEGSDELELLGLNDHAARARHLLRLIEQIQGVN